MTGGLEGLLDAGAALQFGGDGNLAVVLFLHEVHVGEGGGTEDERRHEEGESGKEGDNLVAEAPAEEVGIGGLDGAEGAADGLIEGKEFLLLLGFGIETGLFGEEEGLLLEHLGRGHGDEGDGGGGGDADHDGDNPAEFLEEDTHHAGQHGEGHEDGHKHQGGGDDGGPHLVGGADGGFAWALAAVDVLGDVFENHNGVVDDHTDGHGE